MKAHPSLIALAFMVMGSQAPAQSGPEACVSIGDDGARLRCYDAAMGRGEAPREAPQVTDSATPAQEPAPARAPGPAPARVPEEDDYGLEHKPRPQELEGEGERRMRVAAARHNDFTGWTIEFENGQVWRQVGTDDFRIRVGDSYTVSRGAFNSFFLGGEDDNRKIRVTRQE